MSAAIIDFTGDYALEQGATFRFEMVWKTGTPAVPVDITGCTARCMFKSSPDNRASNITAISKANPGIVTTEGAHKLKSGQTVVLPGVAGMVELTSRYVVTVLSPRTFSIGVDTSAYTTYTSGGTVAFVSITTTDSADGQITLGTTGGEVFIHIKEAVTDRLKGGGTYDVEIVSGVEVRRLSQGAFEVIPNTTR